MQNQGKNLSRKKSYQPNKCMIGLETQEKKFTENLTRKHKCLHLNQNIINSMKNSQKITFKMKKNNT